MIIFFSSSSHLGLHVHTTSFNNKLLEKNLSSAVLMVLIVQAQKLIVFQKNLEPLLNWSSLDVFKEFPSLSYRPTS